jgi:Nucleotide modification associated domain 2
MRDMYVYRLVFDGGCAPHDLDGVMSLALCKPVIRKKAQVGDLVVALAGVCMSDDSEVHNDGSVMWMGVVSEKLSMEECVFDSQSQN